VRHAGRQGRDSADRPAPQRDPLPGAATAQLTVLRLQRTAGNAAVARLLRRALTEQEKAEDLSPGRYSGDPSLEAAFDNDPPLRIGDSGEAVAKVQQGLIDAGFPPARSVDAGLTTGKFQGDTDQAVRAFQRKHKLGVDGAVGRKTLGKLDALAVEQAASPGGPEIPNTEEALGAQIAQGMERANTGYSPTSGIYYDYNYFAEHKRDPGRYPWSDSWRQGLASPAHFDRLGWMDWRLKPGKSASEGIKAWLAGLTIAECLVTIIAVEVDTLRAAIGDHAFDARFGSSDRTVPAKERLRIQQGGETPLRGKGRTVELAEQDVGSPDKRPVQRGDWVYFYNHPRYLLKHPGGAWQGENAVFTGLNPAGKQTFTGLGAAGKTEEAMLDEMVGAYNQARDGADYVALLDTYASNAPEVLKKDRRYLDHDTDYTRSLYEKYKERIPSKYREDSGEFKDTISKGEILSEAAYTLDGRTRKGGFLPHYRRLDPAKVAKLRPAP